MAKAVNIASVLKDLPVLRGRTPDTGEEEAGPSFATLADMGDGGVFAGTFYGESAWERHNNGDELVHILDGHTRLTIIEGSEDTVLELSGGMMTVVPQGCWHRFQAPDGVTVMTVTPQPTDHTATDPRETGEP